MKMTSSELPREWSTKVSSHELVQSGDSQMEAVRNMLVFPLSEICTASSKPDDLNRFLMEVFLAFCMKAERLRRAGLFYAWFDEVSGTLRCSASSVERPAELPFSCEIDIVDVPHEITRAAANSKYISGIPAAELEGVEMEGEAESDSEFRLTVFARPLIRAA